MKDKVAKLCRLLDLTPDDLARRTGVSRQVVLNWLGGRIKASPQAPIIDNALNALEEGFDRRFVLDNVLVNGPLSFLKLRVALTPTPPREEQAGSDSQGKEEDRDPVISNMEKASLDAFYRGHYIQSGLILFQAIETLLRVLIRTQGQMQKVPDKTLLEAAGKEQSFLRLILHLDLLYPDNRISAELRRLNRRRNDTMHRLFYEYESHQELEDKMKEFCLEAQALRDRLADEVHEKVAQLLAARPPADSQRQ